MGYERDIPHHLQWDIKGTLPMGHEWDIINGTRMGHQSGLVEAFSAYETMLKYGIPLIG